MGKPLLYGRMPANKCRRNYKITILQPQDNNWFRQKSSVDVNVLTPVGETCWAQWHVHRSLVYFKYSLYSILTFTKGK